MAGFVASEQVEELAYDFGSYGPSGVTPEPTQAGLNRFLGEMRELASRAGVTGLGENPSPEAVVAAMDEMDEDALEKSNAQMVAALAELCQGKPSREEIAALPARVQQAWTGWIIGQLTDPTQPRRASSP